jgi:hypothetical protein
MPEGKKISASRKFTVWLNFSDGCAVGGLTMMMVPSGRTGVSPMGWLGQLLGGGFGES